MRAQSFARGITSELPVIQEQSSKVTGRTTLSVVRPPCFRKELHWFLRFEQKGEKLASGSAHVLLIHALESGSIIGPKEAHGAPSAKENHRCSAHVVFVLLPWRSQSQQVCLCFSHRRQEGRTIPLPPMRFSPRETRLSLKPWLHA